MEGYLKGMKILTIMSYVCIIILIGVISIGEYWMKRSWNNIHSLNKLFLSYFKDEMNYVGYISLSSPSDLKLGRFRLFWKINGQDGDIKLDNNVIYATFLPNIEKIYIVTISAAYFIDPTTSKKEIMTFGNNCGILLCSSLDNLSEYYLSGFCDKKPYLAIVDTVTKQCKIINVPEFVKGMYKAEEHVYHIITEKAIYKVNNDGTCMNRICEYSKKIKWFCGKWPNNDLILYCDKQGASYVDWGSVQIKIKPFRNAVIISGGYLWVFEERDIQLYDVLGHLYKSIQLKDAPITFDKAENDCIWVYYANMSVDLFDKYGDIVSTIQLNLNLAKNK